MTGGFILVWIFILFVLIVGILALVQKHTRYHEGGTRSDYRNINEYGVPKKSLYIATGVFSLHQHTEVTDDDNNLIYTSKSKVVSLHDRTWIYDSTGNEVSYFYRKFFTIHERHIVEMADGTEFQMVNELFHIVKDITNIEGLGWILEGNIMGMNFTIKDQNEKILAVIGQKAISIRDKYSVDIYDLSKEKYIVTILIALQHMMRDRAVSEASSSSSTSSTN